MFNREMKERFINEVYDNENTKRDIWYLFEKVSTEEEAFGIDVYKFDVYQFEDLLRYLDAKTEESLRKNYSYLNKYYEWAYTKFACSINMTFTTIKPEDLKLYVNAALSENQFIPNREKFYEICNRLTNDADKVILVLLYEGVMGFEMNELRHLLDKSYGSNECSYVNLDKNEIYISGKFRRVIPLTDERSISIIRDAIIEKEYYCLNGNSETKAPIRNLINSRYIIKPINRKGKENTPMSYFSIQTKLGKIQDWIEEPTLTAINIHTSGMFDRLKSIEKQRELTTRDFEEALYIYGKKSNLAGQMKMKYDRFRGI